MTTVTLEERRTGKTTAGLLALIGKAMLSREKEIFLDHYGITNINATNQHARMCQNIIDKLGLKFFKITIELGYLYIQYKPELTYSGSDGFMYKRL